MQYLWIKQSPAFSNIFLFCFSCICMLSIFVWEAHIGINLNDEAFLWYGSAAINQGEVPIRDFYAYDPGRYYFIAFIMKLLGNNGIIASRIAETLFQGFGFFLALYLLNQQLKFGRNFNFILTFSSSVILLLWMIPLYKTFDTTACIALIATFTYLIETNTPLAFFWTGVSISLIAIVGRNHGIYALASATLLMIYLHLTTKQRIGLLKITCWLIGLGVGYAPICYMLMVIPGFSAAFFKGIYFLIANKSTNLFIPIPWPWHADSLANFMLGIFLIALLLFAILSLGYLIWAYFKNKKLSPLFISCALLALPYAHYAFSRADAIHLALGGFPFLIGIFAYIYQLKNKFITITTMLSLFISSLILIAPLHPGVQSYKDKKWESIEISGSQLTVDPISKNDIEFFQRLIAQYANDRQAFLVTPFNIGMYPIFGRNSPMWDLYPLFSRSREDQIADIARIQKANPAFAVIYDLALDGLEQRQFHTTHPLIFKYIADNYELTQDSPVRDIYVYKRKTITDSSL